MSDTNPIPFYEMFPFCAGNDKLTSDFSGAMVLDATVSETSMTMTLTVSLALPAPPVEIAVLEDMIAREFGLNSVVIDAAYARPAQKKSSGKQKKKAALKSGAAIMGRTPRTPPTPIGEISLELGNVTVKGEVCDVSHKELEKSGAWVLSFDLTDYTGTIHVSKYLKDDDAKKIVRSVEKGLTLTVSGKLGFSKKYDGDVGLDPTNIVVAEKTMRTDTAKDKRVELHLHTRMSALDAITDTEEVIRRAAAWGHPAIAITDHGVVQSFPDAAAAAAAVGNKIKVIYGVEGYYSNDVDYMGTGDGAKKKRKRNQHIVLLVKNKTGLNNLYKLVSESHLESFDRYPHIRKSELIKHREGLIIGSACQAGEVFQAVIERRELPEQRSLAEFYDYLEIQPICNNMFMILGDKPIAGSEEDLRGFNRRVYELGRELGKPVVATGDVHFLDPEHEIFRHILLNSRNFESADDNLPVYFKTTDEMLDEFSYLGEEAAYEVVVQNSLDVAGQCEELSPMPPAKTLFLPKLDRSAEDLNELVAARLKSLYGENPPDVILDRLKTELDDILDRNYDVIYMAAQKLVANSMANGYIVGSRGSVGSSIVAFLAGITEVNALPAHYICPNCRKSDFESGAGWGCGLDMPDMDCPDCGAKLNKDGFNIPFETFLGVGGDKVPDIDLNFSGEYQTSAHKFASDLFGAGFVYRAGTIGTVQDKTAYGYVRKYVEDSGRKLSKAEENRLARGCVKVKQTTGQHPGGLVIIPQDMEITDFCPVQHPADHSDKGIITTHFDYHCMEDNLIKLDVLGHDDPTMLKMLQDMTGVNARDIRLDDPETMEIFTSPLPLGLPDDDDVIGATGTIGIPEFGTNLTRQMLCDTEPRDFDTLVRLSGYAHGTDVWVGNARDLILNGKAAVRETISCRDDIMLFLISKGMDSRHAFTISESVRKGKRLPEGAEEDMYDLGVPDWYIQSCKKISYLFPKAHAAAYVIMAFRIAWFKVHRPLEFYCAYFYRRSRKDSFEAESMTRGFDVARAKIAQLRNSGAVVSNNAKTKEKALLTTLEACYEFYMRGFEFAALDLYESDPLKFLIKGDKKLRPPLIAVGGLGETVARDIAEGRAGNIFISIADISAACPKVSKKHIEQLKSLGALRDLPETSQMSLF